MWETRHWHIFICRPIPVKDYNYYAGNGADELVRKMLEAVPGGDQADYEQVRTLYRKWFEEDPFYHVKPFPGIVKLLENLKNEGLKIAVLSNKPHRAAIEVVEKIFGADMFHKVQGQTEKVPRKPSPIGALTIAEEFKVSPKECLYMGRYRYRYGNRPWSRYVHHRRNLGVPSQKGTGRPPGRSDRRQTGRDPGVCEKEQKSGEIMTEQACVIKRPAYIQTIREEMRMNELQRRMYFDLFEESGTSCFSEPVAETMEEAEAFLEDCMAAVVGSLKDSTEYFEENGMDVERNVR